MIFLIVFLFISISAFAQQSSRNINIGLVPPLSSNWIYASRDTNSFSLNAIVGLSAAENGVAIAGFANLVRHTANGTLIAGFMNTSGGGNGFELAGFGNFSRTGSGGQVAGFINMGGNISALQAAGFINLAANVKGLQLSGFINKAKYVQGVQISGFINIADSAEYQIGLVNISKNGDMAIGASIDENHTTLLSLRSGGKLLYGIVGLGDNAAGKKNAYAFEVGLGAHIVHAEPFLFNAELTNTSLLNFKGLTYHRSAFALLPSFNLGNRFTLFAGPSFVGVQARASDDILRQQHFIYSWGGENGNDFHAIYIGYNAGIAIRL